MASNKIYDSIIIGCGPSGLSAASVLEKENYDFLIFDRGDQLYLRKVKNPVDVVTGIGGCGLYSDGKISYFPSGSGLYSLNRTYLKKSFKHISEILSQHQIQVPQFEDLSYGVSNSNFGIVKKKYDSTLLSSTELFQLALHFFSLVGKERIQIRHKLVQITKDVKGIYNLTFEHDQKKATFLTKSLLYCGGRFGSIHLHNLITDQKQLFKNFELSFRIECDYSNFDFQDDQVDIKVIIKDKQFPNFEFRTYCFCRKGYIIQGKFDEYNTYNGVSNTNNGKTNFGLNLRISDENTYMKFQNEITEILKTKFNTTLKEFLDNDTNSDLLNSYRHILKKHFPLLSSSKATIIGASLEQTGYYPILNDALKMEAENIWVCGDASGQFRGLLPSLISGTIGAIDVTDFLKREENDLLSLIRIKSSPTQKLKTVFTAQSKKYFYAKDVICEFVFNQGNIPVNPFQSFGYFLNDRIDRALVRNGNNELITRCDELWVFGPIADGVLYEIYRAHKLKLPIRFFSIGTLSKEILPITDINKLTFEPETYSQIGKENLLRFIERHATGGSQQLKLEI